MEEESEELLLGGGGVQHSLTGKRRGYNIDRYHVVIIHFQNLMSFPGDWFGRGEIQKKPRKKRTKTKRKLQKEKKTAIEKTKTKHEKHLKMK